MATNGTVEARVLESASSSGRDIRNHMLFEVSTEAANRVGGIYSVIKSKAPVTTAEYGDRYTLIGPLNRASAAVEVEPLVPTNPELAETISAMQSRGIGIVYGRWLIEGAPRIILIDTKTGYSWLDEWKADLWNTAGIPSPPGDDETNEAVVFGYLVAWFLGEFVAHERKRAIIAHFHEWLAGVALPLTKKRRMDVTTIFTTHATLLGRYLCAGSVDFYNNLQYFDVDAEAGKRGIYHRYCIERAAAHASDVFTTVSHITAYESEHLLKRKPDGVLPNGLNVKKFSAMHEFQNLHQQSKEKIHDFVRGHFYGHNDFEPDNTLYFFTAGRYEYRNKGVDMFIESLARLNHSLKNSGSKMTVVAFIILPAKTTSLTVEALKGQAVIKSLRDTVDIIEKEVGKRLFDRSLQWHDGDDMPEHKDLLSSSDRVMLRRRLFGMKRNTLPPVVTHNMANDAEDPVLNQIRRVQLFNHPSDRVKVIFHPEFLNSANPVLPLDYDDFVRGCHMGIFPSYYEPWGYTPAECTVMGVPSITTNLSGFGCYMEELIENASDYGIYIVDRRMKGVDDSVNQLTSFMFDFASKSKRQRINQRNRTERLSDLLDWKRMGMEYVKARQLALRRAYPASFDDDYDEAGIFDAIEPKLARPLSVPGSPRNRSGMMTPGDFGSLQEGREGLSTEDYIAWKLPEEEDPDDYNFPLTLKKPTPAASPVPRELNGTHFSVLITFALIRKQATKALSQSQLNIKDITRVLPYLHPSELQDIIPPTTMSRTYYHVLEHEFKHLGKTTCRRNTAPFNDFVLANHEISPTEEPNVRYSHTSIFGTEMLFQNEPKHLTPEEQRRSLTVRNIIDDDAWSVETAMGSEDSEHRKTGARDVRDRETRMDGADEIPDQQRSPLSVPSTHAPSSSHFPTPQSPPTPAPPATSHARSHNAYDVVTFNQRLSRPFDPIELEKYIGMRQNFNWRLSRPFDPFTVGRELAAMQGQGYNR